MASPEEQIIAAIAVASDPSHHGPQIQAEAIEFLTKVRRESSQSWRPALSLFVATTEDDTQRRFSADVRLFALNIVDDYLELRHGKGALDAADFETLRDAFMAYLRSEYLFGSAEAKSPFIRNKFSHTLTLLFLATYETLWPDFFSSVFQLLKPPEETGIPPLNAHVSVFFFRLLLEISSEVADQILKNARHFNAERHARDGRIRDRIRENHAVEINQAVLTIVMNKKQRLDQIRNGDVSEKPEPLEEIVDLGMRAFASYVPWIDINLTVTPETIPLLFSLLSDNSLTIRLATCSALQNIVQKGLKVPSDKVNLIQVLSLSPVLDQLEAQSRDQNLAPGSRREEAVESYREALGRVTNALGLELLLLCNDTRLSADEQQTSTELLGEVIPLAMRFLSDAYDDTSGTVFPMVNEILVAYKKAKQASPQLHMTSEKRDFLESLLRILIDKLKWDGDEDPESLDPEDEMAFETLRKDIRKFVDAILQLDTELVTEAVADRAHTTLSAYEAGTQLPWDVAELAIYLVFMYGELGGKDKGKGRLAFCIAPNVPKLERKAVDYSNYPLTPQGEMMQALVRSRISAFPHPTVAMQFFETATRYADFFKVRKEHVLPALEAFLDNRGVHHPHIAVRKRVYYLFHRFVQALRVDIAVEHVAPILQAIQDLLGAVHVELPPDFEPPTGSDFLVEVVKEPTMFDSQLYLYEAAGALVSVLWSMPQPQAAALQTLSSPLLIRLSELLAVIRTMPGVAGSEEDYISILTVHHLIQALGNIPKGFNEFPSPVPNDYIMPPIAEFRQISEAILVSVEVAGRYRIVREAARFAFGRLIHTAGPSITEYIPRLLEQLLLYFEASEVGEFIGFLAHMTHKLQGQLKEVLDQVFIPLTSHIGSVLSQHINGTDDKVIKAETKKAYLSFLNTVMTSNLGAIFVSERNAPNLGVFSETLLQLAADASDPLNQKLSLLFLSKFLSTFGGVNTSASGDGTIAANGNHAAPSVPGIEQFIYQRVLLVAFTIPTMPEFNIKDGQAVIVLNEIASLLQTIVKVRGDEASTYLTTVFLPGQNCPEPVANELVNNLRSMDKRAFQKFFADFVKSSRSGIARA